MNVTLTSLEALILKATNEALPCPDPAALEAFCAVMQQSSDGPQMAAQTLAARIHVPHTQKALLALAMTDKCMRKCGSEFHAEVGKFRFLNEMIKLVSPKYLADRTAPEVRTRVLQLLHAWSIEFPQEFKFKVAYDMLKNQGVITETPPPLPPEEGVLPPKARIKNPIIEDAEKTKLLQKLLQSKKPEDIQHANRLIKTMVREEERRCEASSRREQDLSTALDSASLLSDMLEYTHCASPEDIQLIHDLHSIVSKMRGALDEMASYAAETDGLDEVLKANDILDDINERYNAFVAHQNEKKDDKASTNHNSLLDFAGANMEGDSANIVPKKVAKNSIDELGDIFSTDGASGIAAPLQPVNMMPSDDVDLLGEKPKTEGWNELDSLGEQLLKQSLPGNAKRVDGFNSKSKKIPMNALTSPKREEPISTPVFDLDFFTKKPEDDKPSLEVKNISPTSNDDVMVDITESTDNILNFDPPKETTINVVKENANGKAKVDVKPLTDIVVTLESVEPSNVPPLTAYEEKDGVTVVLHFCKDRPRPDVNVVVISTTSRSRHLIEDYKIQCVVPKGCKVRLLPASGTSLPVFNPFLPPPALTQVMLIARPPSHPPIDLKFVLTYTSEDDVCSEMGEVKELPLDDIQ